MGKLHMGLNSKGSIDRMTLSSTAHAWPPRLPALIEPAWDANRHGWHVPPMAESRGPVHRRQVLQVWKAVLQPKNWSFRDWGWNQPKFPMASHTADPRHTVLRGGPSSVRKYRALGPPWPNATNTKLQRELENLEACTEGRFHSYLRLCRQGAVHLAWRLTPGCLHNRVVWKGFGWSVAGRDCSLLHGLRWQGLPSIHLVGGCNAGRLPRLPPQTLPGDLLPSLQVLRRQCYRKNRSRSCQYHLQTRVRHQVRKEREVGGGRGTIARPKEGSPLFSPQEAQPLRGILFFILICLLGCVGSWLHQVGWFVVAHGLSSCGLSSCSVQT